MFAKTIIDSDAFLDMPASTQMLYFHLSMRADDEGFINNPKKIQRMVCSTDDDFKLLLAKKFIISFDSGVVVIKHWKIHNIIRMDRFSKTLYQEEKKSLSIDNSKSYTLKNNGCIPNVIPNVIPTVNPSKDKISKDKLIKDNTTKNNYKKFIEFLKEKATIPSKVTSTRKGEELYKGIDDKKKLIVDYLEHQEEKGEFAKRITAYMEDYKATSKETVISNSLSYKNHFFVSKSKFDDWNSKNNNEFILLEDGSVTKRGDSNV